LYKSTHDDVTNFITNCTTAMIKRNNYGDNVPFHKDAHRIGIQP